MPYPKFELLKEAYSIIDGIPANRIHLASLMHSRTEHPFDDPESMCCPLGWLVRNADFVEKTGREFRVFPYRTNFSGLPVYDIEIYVGSSFVDWSAAGELMFGVQRSKATQLFMGVASYELEESTTHKGLWQKRVQHFLKECGQL